MWGMEEFGEGEGVEMVKKKVQYSYMKFSKYKINRII